MKNLLPTLVALTSLSLIVGCSDPSGGGEKVGETYENGQKKSEGYRLDDGTKVGLWTQWHKNGQRQIEVEMKNGKAEGRMTLWHENGQKQTEGEMKNDKHEGPWPIWLENGDKMGEGEYKNGKKEGLWTVWFENGQKAFECEYKNGQKEGLCSFWKKDGTINTSRGGIYKADKKVAPLPKK